MSQEFEQDKRKRGPGGSDEFLETEEQPQKMPEERLRLGGDVARPTVPKDARTPGSKGQKVDRPQEPLRKKKNQS